MPKKRGRPSRLDLALREQTAKFFPGVIGLSSQEEELVSE